MIDFFNNDHEKSSITLDFSILSKHDLPKLRLICEKNHFNKSLLFCSIVDVMLEKYYV